jgi:undecaprenyl-phosphate galactose phosphotransferase/putative colanic acid biosynthesis UDP-glucose lipid carrier transferase
VLQRLDRSGADAIAIGPARKYPWLSFEAVASVLPLLDILIILAASVVSALAYQYVTSEAPYTLIAPADLTSALGVGMLAGCIYALWMHSVSHYDIRLCLQARLASGQILRAWAFTALMLAMVAFFLKVGASYSRATFLVFLLTAPMGLVAWRALTKPLLRTWIKNGVIGRRQVVLIGDNDELDSLDPAQFLNYFGIVDAKRFTLHHFGERSSTPSDVAVLKAAVDFARANNSDEILLALPWRDTDAVQSVRNRLRTLPIPVRLLPDRSLRTITSYPSFASSLQLSFLVELQAAPLNYFDRMIKRLMDIVFGSIAAMVALPIVILAIIAIKLDSPGPGVFRQRRNGFNGKQFVIYKLRSMTTQDDGANIRQASRRDARITGVGRFLRKTSIDELPQLLNVLRGEMSLVGPRPHAVAHDDEFQGTVADYAFRHHVKPGITGWAQCHGSRGATPSLKEIVTRVELDLWYINNWSPWLDLRILFLTVFEVLRWNRAY